MLLAFAFVASVVGRAEPLSEFYLRFARGGFARLGRACADDEACGTDMAEPLRRLESLVPQTSLQFETTREMGNRLARLDQGDVLVLNRELLFNAREGTLVRWAYPEAVEFLAQTWAPRLKITERDQAELVGRLRRYAVRATERLVEPRARQIALTLFHAPVSALVLEEKDEAFEVPFAQALSCGPTTGVDEPPTEIVVRDVRWASARGAGRDRRRLSAVGDLAYGCRGKRYDSNFMVQVDTVLSGGHWALEMGTLRVSQNGIRPLL